MEAVRRKIDREEERQREERQQLRSDFHRQGDLEDAIDAGRKVCILGFVPAAVIMLRFAYLGGYISIPFVFMGLVGMGFIGYFAPQASGIAANYLFYSSELSTRRAAIVLVLLVEIAFGGWMFLFYEGLLR